MKVKDLLVRKGELKEQHKNILAEIGQLTSKMETEDLQKFIRTGDSSQVDGRQLEKLQRKRKHLTLLQGSLNREIVKTSQKEREKRIVKLKKHAGEFALVREKIKSRVHHFQEKIVKLVEESQEIHRKEDELRTQASQEGKETFEVSLRLGKLEEFLKENIIIDDEIEEKVKEARHHNRKLLEEDRISINDTIYQNFRVKWDRPSARVLEFELTTQPAEKLLRAEHVTKESLLQEVC